MNRLVALVLGLSFLFVSCELNTANENINDNGDFLSRVDRGKVLIIVSHGLGLDNNVLQEEEEDAVYEWLSNNAEELKIWYEDSRRDNPTNAKVDIIKVSTLASLKEGVADLYDTTPKHGKNPDGTLQTIGTFKNRVDSKLEEIVESGKTYDRVIVMAPGTPNGPLFTGNKIPGYNWPKDRSGTNYDETQRYAEKFYGALGDVTNADGWIYFTGVDPDIKTKIDGFSNFLEFATCLTGRHTVASRTANVMWPEHRQIMKMDNSDAVRFEHNVTGVKVQKTCDVTLESKYTCRSKANKNACKSGTNSFTRSWGACDEQPGQCVDVEKGDYSYENTLKGQCDGPVNIRCFPEPGSEKWPKQPKTSVHERCRTAAGWCIDSAPGLDWDCHEIQDRSSLLESECLNHISPYVLCCEDKHSTEIENSQGDVNVDDSDGAKCDFRDGDANGICVEDVSGCRSYHFSEDSNCEVEGYFCCELDDSDSANSEDAESGESDDVESDDNGDLNLCSTHRGECMSLDDCESKSYWNGTSDCGGDTICCDMKR